MMTDSDNLTENRWIALYVLCAGMLMIVLDVTVVNVALPSIQDDLGFSQSSLAWVVNAYLIAFGGLLLLAGRFGDILGRKSVFMAGLGVFTVASLLCGLAQSQEMLVGARFVQGVGGAMTSAVILGMIVTMFPEPREQAKAIGVYAFVASAGGSVGLLAGGVLTQSINWHWIFFVNIPIGIATAVLAVAAARPGQGHRLRRGRRRPGRGPDHELPDARRLHDRQAGGRATAGARAATLGLGAVSLVLLVAFVVREARARNPLVPLRIFRSRNVSGANVIQVLSVAGMFGMFFLGALYLQRVLGYDALADRPRVPARDDRDGDAVRPLHRAADHALRRQDDAAPRPGAHRAGLALFTQAPVDGSYVQSRPAGDDPARLRRRRSPSRR